MLRLHAPQLRVGFPFADADDTPGRAAQCEVRLLRIQLAARPQGGGTSTSQGHPRTIFRRALERGNLLRPLRGPLAVPLSREHEKATLEVGLLVANLRSLAPPEDHASALAILRKAAR